MESETIEIGEGDYKFYNVQGNPGQECVVGDKIYFADGRDSHGKEQYPCRFGCFDRKTKKIDFIQDLPGTPMSGIYKILYNDGKLYIHNTSNELFVFEEELLT